MLVIFGGQDEKKNLQKDLYRFEVDKDSLKVTVRKSKVIGV